MDEKPSLHVLFTLNCEMIPNRSTREGPRTFERSVRGIDGYSTRALRAGFPPTLFIAPDLAYEHGPLFDELHDRGAELGVYIHPPSIGEGRFKRSMGNYNAADQRAITEYCVERLTDVLGVRPRSVRTGRASANDATFPVLYELGLQQGSLSQPGCVRSAIGVNWLDADENAHYVDANDHRHAGDLPFLEIPITTDPTIKMPTGQPYELCVEYGTFDALHLPVIERRLAAMEATQERFRAICIYAHNSIDFHLTDAKHIATLEALLDFFHALADRYQIVPCTLAGAHQEYRRWRVR